MIKHITSATPTNAVGILYVEAETFKEVFE